jgi:hypothetical protein
MHRRRWYHTLSETLLCIVCTVGGPTAPAAEQFSGDSLKAAYLYRFPRYVDWPGEPRNSTFTIAVLGARSLADELERMLAGQTIKARPARVRKINSIAEIGDAQVVFVGSDQAPSTIRRTVDALEGRSVLLVTDGQDMGLGGTINFVQVERHIRFEVSLPAAKRSRLAISSELLSVALKVHEAGGVTRAKEAVLQ